MRPSRYALSTHRIVARSPIPQEFLSLLPSGFLEGFKRAFVTLVRGVLSEAVAGLKRYSGLSPRGSAGSKLTWVKKKNSP